MRTRRTPWIQLNLLILIFIFSGCATNTVSPDRASLPAPVHPPLPPPLKQNLVAIAGFENRSAFAADKLWDTCSQQLSTHLIEMGFFRVVEWERMKKLFSWDALSTSSLVKIPEKRDEARKILLCEYFISGAITYFDVSRHSRVSAISKQKTFYTTVRVDLSLQDAMTGEYVAAASAETIETQVFTGGVAGGETGTWSPRSADLALNKAIKEALYELTIRFEKLSLKESNNKK
ncbi:MAG TPA: CsgG/HfaB family protein [Thermodesulfobacteriota bacterium]|nr:MAG: hypothetical protein A2V65_02115 [Deltaproteobacteria bacterium RBG_13_49_15]HJX31336.1 CsgG/HfaB family protein [Thermodesulfobacteriota bacterium]